MKRVWSSILEIFVWYCEVGSGVLVVVKRFWSSEVGSGVLKRFWSSVLELHARKREKNRKESGAGMGVMTCRHAVQSRARGVSPEQL